MAQHDESYKLLFSHPQMVQDLLTGFVPEEWVRSVDFAALEVSDVLEEHPAGLERYRPRARYLVLDEGAFAEADLASLRNLAAAVFRLENSRSPERKTFGRWSRTSSSGSGLRSRRVCAARLRSGSSESCYLPGSRASIFLK